MKRYYQYRERKLQQFRNEMVNPLSDFNPPIDGEYEAERIRPARPPGLESDLLVPLGWSLIISTTIFLVTLYLIIFFDVTWHIVIPVTLFSFGLSFALGIGAVNKTIWMIERIFQTDLDNDNQIGVPEIKVSDLTAIIPREDGYKQVLRARFEVEPEKLYSWAVEATQGRSLAINNWTGSNGPFERKEYQKLLETLSEMGMTEKKSGNKGWQLTRRGEAYFAQFLTDYQNTLNTPTIA